MLPRPFFGAHLERSCDAKVSITVFIRDLKNIFLIRLVPYLISSDRSGAEFLWDKQPRTRRHLREPLYYTSWQ